MALIKCPECGKDVSSEAIQCLNCGFKINTKKIEATKLKYKKIGIITFLIIILIAILITYMLITRVILNKREKLVYNAVYDIQPKFKFPSSIKVTDIKICGSNYAILNISGKNSYGTTSTITYYLDNNKMYSLDDSRTKAKKVVNKCFKLEKKNSNNLVVLNKNSIDKINNKLSKRYK